MFCKFEKSYAHHSLIHLSFSLPLSFSPSPLSSSPRSMCGVLHPHSHNHGHGHSHGKDKDQVNKLAGNSSINVTLKDFSGNTSKRDQKLKFWQRKNRQHNKHGSEENINVRAAFIHVIGDLIQSIGVVIAGYIIKFKVLKTGTSDWCRSV